MNPIYTIGYGAGWTPARLGAEVQRLGAALWDIRYSPRSRTPVWNEQALRSLVGAANYAHAFPLGNRNYRGDGPITLVNPAATVGIAQRTLAQRPVILLCGCRDAATCHRSVAADYLAAATGAPVIHLEPPHAAGSSDILGLSLNPPWGALIAVAATRPDLGKRVETRGWKPRMNPALLAIHQTKGLGAVGSEADLAALCAREPFASALTAVGITSAAQLPRGSVVAVAQVAACHATDDLAWLQQLSPRELAFGGYDPGRFGWCLTSIRAVAAPVACRGGMGLWPVPADVADQIKEQSPVDISDSI